MEHDGWIPEAEAAISTALKNAAAKRPLDGVAAERAMSDGLQRWLQRRHRRTPVVTVIVVDAD